MKLGHMKYDMVDFETMSISIIVYRHYAFRLCCMMNRGNMNI